MLSKAIVKDVINACLATGGDFAEVFYEENIDKIVPSLLNTKVPSSFPIK